MNKEWTKVLVAGMFEVGWVIGLKHASNLFEWGLTILAIFLVFI